MLLGSPGRGAGFVAFQNLWGRTFGLSHAGLGCDWPGGLSGVPTGHWPGGAPLAAWLELWDWPSDLACQHCLGLVILIWVNYFVGNGDQRTYRQPCV